MYFSLSKVSSRNGGSAEQKAHAAVKGRAQPLYIHYKYSNFINRRKVGGGQSRFPLLSRCSGRRRVRSRSWAEVLLDGACGREPLLRHCAMHPCPALQRAEQLRLAHATIGVSVKQPDQRRAPRARSKRLARRRRHLARAEATGGLVLGFSIRV